MRNLVCPGLSSVSDFSHFLGMDRAGGLDKGQGFSWPIPWINSAELSGYPQFHCLSTLDDFFEGGHVTEEFQSNRHLFFAVVGVVLVLYVCYFLVLGCHNTNLTCYDIKGWNVIVFGSIGKYDLLEWVQHSCPLGGVWGVGLFLLDPKWGRYPLLSKSPNRGKVKHMANNHVHKSEALNMC